MALNSVSLVFTEQDAGSGASTGSVVVAPTSAVVAAGVTVVSQQPVIRAFGGGTVTVSLVATDNTGTTPAAGFWAYNITLPGGSPQTYLLPFSGGATQQFSNLTPAVASTTYGPAAGGTGGFTNPMTTLGDLIFENATPAAARMAGDTSNARKFLRTQASGGVAQAPAWDTIQAADVPTLNQSTTGNAATATAAAGLETATTTVAVSAATAPSSGQVLTATSTTAATWQSPGGGYQAWQFPVGAPSGSDDTTTIQTAINSAATYATAHNYYAEIVFQPGVYLVQGALKHGTPTFGYSQLTLPVVPISGNPTMVLKFTGTQCNSGPPMFTAGGDTPAAGTEGTVLKTTLTGQAYSSSFGYPCILGAPTPEQGYTGAFTNLWNNLMPVIDGITFMAPLNPSMTGADLRSCVKVEIPWGRALANGTMAQMAAQDPATGGGNGILLPQGGNNAHNVIGAWTSAGFQTGLVMYENTSFEQISTFYCDVGLAADFHNAGHGIAGTLYIAGGNNTHLQIQQDASPTFLFPLDIVEMQCENASQYSAGFYIDDGSTNGVGGRIGLSTSEALSNVSVRGAANLEIILGSTAGGGGGGGRSVNSAPTYTLGTAFQNPWWRHQWITLNSGTTTGILIGSTSTTCTTSVGTTTAAPVSFRLPSGWWLNIQGSVKPTTFTAVPD